MEEQHVEKRNWEMEKRRDWVVPKAEKWQIREGTRMMVYWMKELDYRAERKWVGT
ncbi:hypothetical protein KY284_035520 [Solanum tuberosum]|nr:hypothetical protein KY284_035520 [Solanum tuberosum]